jgi:tetratricopeptide (TPR) repeat protein
MRDAYRSGDLVSSWLDRKNFCSPGSSSVPMFGGMSRTVTRILLILLCCGRTLAAQDPVRADTAAVRDTTASAIDSARGSTVAEAGSLRDKREFTAAAEMLRDILLREPDNGDAARMLAQTLYWLGNPRAARALYEESMRKHPGDFTLRLEYARMLVETLDDARAIEILTPLLDLPEARGRAASLTGTLYYWNGEYTRAKRYFSVALAADSGLVDARRQLSEIQAASAPWVVVGASGLSDDQPLDRIEGELEGGLYLNPLATVSAMVRPMYFSTTDVTSLTAVVADAGVSLSIPSARLETRFGGGVVQRSDSGASPDWTARAALTLRLPAHAFIEAQADRSAYFWTAGSVSVPSMTERAAIVAGLTHPREWVAESAYRIERHEDGNQIRSAYAWMLAPILRSSGASVGAGYSISWQDSDETTFTGVYFPYYTPENIVTHSAITAVTLRPSPKSTFRLNGSYGFFAREDAPVLLPSLAIDNLIWFDRRDFKPWNAHASYETALSSGTSLTFAIQSMKTAFYRATSGGIRFTYRFRQRTVR